MISIRLLTDRSSQICKYLNFFPEETLFQLYQSEKKEECLPDVIAIEVQRTSSVLNLNVKNERKAFFPPKLGPDHDFTNSMRR